MLGQHPRGSRLRSLVASFISVSFSIMLLLRMVRKRHHTLNVIAKGFDDPRVDLLREFLSLLSSVQNSLISSLADGPDALVRNKVDQRNVAPWTSELRVSLEFSNSFTKVVAALAAAKPHILEIKQILDHRDAFQTETLVSELESP